MRTAVNYLIGRSDDCLNINQVNLDSWTLLALDSQIDRLAIIIIVALALDPWLNIDVLQVGQVLAASQGD